MEKYTNKNTTYFDINKKREFIKLIKRKDN